MAVPIVHIELDDVVRLKKPHACGGNAWRVIKLGMDVGLECTRCGRHVRLVRYDFDRRFRAYISRASAPPPSASIPGRAAPGRRGAGSGDHGPEGPGPEGPDPDG